MTWQLYAVAAMGLGVIAVAMAAVMLIGLDTDMAIGLGAGVAVSVPMMLFSAMTAGRALRENDKSAMLGHLMGGFGLRLVVLVIGFGAIGLTGWGNPAGFAIAFLVGVVLMLGLNVLRFARGMKLQVQV
ncbi:MAG: hypothetical protein IPP14_14320 [Planctomycetes bacterium]|nr:hypothetical protein [Planctomycetota bacterium]